MISLEREDIQSLASHGNGQLGHASYELLQVVDRGAAARWLAALAPRLTTTYDRPPVEAYAIAFTRAGLDAFGVRPALVAGLLREFNEGIVTDHRSRILGDVGDSAPATWRWGGPANSEIHIVLSLFGDTPATLERVRRDELDAHSGCRILASLDSELLPAAKEHFGFHDGISNPVVMGTKTCATPENALMPGEFVLGYRDEYGQYAITPRVDPAADPHAEILPRSWDDTALRDFGRNGSYMIFRQLEQDVKGFWSWLDRMAAGTARASRHLQVRERLAAKMIGRWPSGAPLVLAPDRDVLPRIAALEGEIEDAKKAGDPRRMKALEARLTEVRALTTAHAFGYFETDPDGLACPFGSHLRRANPRDSLVDDDDRTPTDASIEDRLAQIDVSRHHRIIRRGRPYGAPADGFIRDDGSIDPDRVIASDDDAERGLYFVGINADIARQFEFIHHTWLNSGKFAGLENDPDPLMGAGTSGQPGPDFFTIPDRPVRERITGLHRWVTVRGGAYLFMPGIRCVRYIASVGMET